jgi:hypothetical protein
MDRRMFPRPFGAKNLPLICRPVRESAPPELAAAPVLFLPLPGWG